MHEHESYHVDYFPPNDVWPKGGWSVHKINGDQIADRVVREKVNPKGYYEGGVIARHSWCGYIGISPTLEGIVGLIKDGDK